MKRLLHSSLPAIVIALLFSLVPSLTSAADFVRGDVNHDGEVNLHDACLILAEARDGGVLDCLDAADVNDDGTVTRDDAESALDFLYEAGSAPAGPYPAAGGDPTVDGLLCAGAEANEVTIDGSFSLELKPNTFSSGGGRGAVELHGWLDIPRPISGLWLKLALDNDLLCRVRALVPESVKEPDRFAAARMTDDGADVGVIFAMDGSSNLPIGQRFHAFTIRLCANMPTPQAGIGWDLPVDIVEVGFSIPGEPSAIHGAGEVPPVRVNWGSSSDTPPSCYYEIPSPDFLTCQTLDDNGRVRLDWVNPIAYDEIHIGRFGHTAVYLPGNATSWTDEEGGFDHNFVYWVSGFILSEDSGVREVAGKSLGVSCAGEDPRGSVSFVRGDANADGVLSTADVLSIRDWLFNGNAPPTCIDSADVNDDGRVNLTDGVTLLRYLFAGAYPGETEAGPPAPYPAPGEDPTHAGEDWNTTCDAYTVIPAQMTYDAIRLGQVDTAPGQAVEIPIYLTNQVTVDAIQLVVQYDATRLKVESGGDTIAYDGSFFEPFIEQRWYTTDSGHFTWEGPHASKVDTFPEEGIFTLTIIPTFAYRGYFEIPPGEETLVGKIRAFVSPDVPAGSILTLTPLGGEEYEGFGEYKLRSELAYQGEGRYATILPSTFEGIMRIGIDGDISFFIRGDANGDRTVNIADPITTLGYLFLGKSDLPCPDAADSDDSGVLELTDAVVTLSHLFLGTASLPPPYPEAGVDPNPDFLEMCQVAK